MLANIHSILASESCCLCLYYAQDVGLPTQFQYNIGPVSQPIAGSMLTNCLRRWPNTTPNTGSAVYLAAAPQANSCHLPNTVLMLAQRLLRRPGSAALLLPCRKSHYPDNKIHWPNADVMLGYRL